MPEHYIEHFVEHFNCKLYFLLLTCCLFSISFPDPNGTQRKGTVFITGTVDSVIYARAQLIVSINELDFSSIIES